MWNAASSVCLPPPLQGTSLLPALSFYPALLSRCLPLSLSTPDIRHLISENSFFASRRPPKFARHRRVTDQCLCADELRCK